MTDPIVDLVDPIRLVISLLPPTWQAPAAVVVSTLASIVTIASLITARLPLSARQHPRYGWAVRVLHRVSLLRLRDERGTTKLPGAVVEERVTVAPVGRETAAQLGDAVHVTSPTSAVLLMGEVALASLPLVESAGKEGAGIVSETRGAFDPAARQTIAPDVVAEAQRLTRESERGSVDLAGLIGCVVIAALATVIACGCGPRVLREPTPATPPDGCVGGATVCHDGAPWRCSRGRWSQADRVCSRLGTDASPPPVCCLTQSALREDAVLHACVPQVACIAETP